MFTVPISGTAINTAQISIDTTIQSGNISCTNISGSNATFNQLSTTTFNPANLNTSNVNTQNLNVVNTIPLLNVSVLNTSQKNTSNMSVTNLSVTNFTADNISTGSLIAGTNINISNNVISAENDALLPANANFSSINSCSLSVTGTTILGGTSYVSDSLIVTNAVNASTISANNLSTGDLTFSSPLTYNSSTKELSCEVYTTAVSGSPFPVSSGALYNALANFSEQPSLMHTSLYRKGLTNYDVTIVNSSLSAGASGTLFYVDYNPKFEDSLIKVTAYFSYSIGGHGTDAAEFQLKIGRANNTITRTDQIIYQKWTGTSGGGTRSGAGSAVGGVYPQQDSLTSGLFHRIQIYYNNNSDDTFALTDSGNYIAIEVLETIDTQSTYNNNIRIGDGNISCGDIDCNDISCNILSPNSVNIQVSDSNIGQLTMGFSPTSIATESSIVMASGGSFLKSVTMENLSDDFNISSRSSGKTFRFSGGQVPLLEITDANTSCQDLIVNGNLDVVGNISFTNSNHGNINASQIIITTMLVESNATFDNMDIGGDVEISDIGSLSSFNNSFNNMSANNASIVNLSVTGSITGSNLSTASLTAGSNISILNGSISAYIEGGTDWDVSSIHVDNDVEIFGRLNVSETSTFQQSLNVENQLFLGKAGDLDGQLVLYSNLIGNNLVISNNGDDTCSITGQGLTDEINISLGGNEIVEFLNDTVNINGFLNVSNISINNSVDVSELTTNEINISDTNSTGQYTRIHRQGNQTFFVGNNATLGCDYKFYTGTDSQNLALEINRSLTTTINRLEVVNTMESVNICTDNNISCSGSMTIANDLSVTGDLILNNLNVSQINNSTLNSITINNSTIDSDTAFISTINCSIINVSNNVNVCGNINTCGEANVSGNLNVSGYSYFQREVFFYDDLFLFGNEISLGDPNGGSNTELYIHSNTAGDTLRMAHVSETEFIFKLIDTNESMNFLIGNTSVLVLDNTQAKFNKNVNISGTLSADSIDNLINVCSTNISTTNLSVTEATFTEIDFPIQSPFLYFNPLDNKLNISVKAIEDDIFGGTINVSIVNVCRLDAYNICFEGPLFSPGKIDWRGLANKIETDIFNGSTMNASFLDAINASVSNDLDVDGILDCFDLVADTGSIGVLDSTTINTSNFNVSNFSASNLSTASMLFSNDFQFALNTLSLAPSETASAIQAATLSALNTSVNSLQGNFSTINADFGIIGGTLNANTMNISTLNASTINGENLSTGSVIFSNEFQFAFNTLSLATDQTAAAIQAATLTTLNSSVNSAQVNASQGNFSTMNATFSTIGGILNSNIVNISTLNYSSANGINLSATNLSVSNDLQVDGQIDAFDLVSDTGSITTFDSTTTNVSSLNVSTINGYTAITTVAIAKYNGIAQTNLRAVGCTVTRNSVGKYTCTFTNALPDDTYVVNATVVESATDRDDMIVTTDLNSASSTGFSLSITEQDNGATAGVLTDAIFFLSVFY